MPARSARPLRRALHSTTAWTATACAVTAGVAITVGVTGATAAPRPAPVTASAGLAAATGLARPQLSGGPVPATRTEAPYPDHKGRRLLIGVPARPVVKRAVPVPAVKRAVVAQPPARARVAPRPAPVRQQPAATPTRAPVPPPYIAGSGLGARAVALAASRAGSPYVFAAAGPSAFDCSGLTMWVYAQLGISLPHNAATQYDVVQHIPQSAKQPGDLLFFPEGGGGIGHVTIYAGGNMMWAARHTGTVVGIQSIYTTDYYVGRPG